MTATCRHPVCHLAAAAAGECLIEPGPRDWVVRGGEPPATATADEWAEVHEVLAQIDHAAVEAMLLAKNQQALIERLADLAKREAGKVNQISRGADRQRRAAGILATIGALGPTSPTFELTPEERKAARHREEEAAMEAHANETAGDDSALDS